MYVLQKVQRISAHSNRCCFRTSVENEYIQEATECFKKPPHDELRELDNVAVVDWLTGLPDGGDKKFARALQDASKLVGENGFNGLALQAMGKLSLKEFLGVEDKDHATKLLCLIEAAKFGVAVDRCLESSFLGRYSMMHGLVDPWVFWTLKTNVQLSTWTAQAASRLISSAASYLTQYSEYPLGLQAFIDMSIDATFVKGNIDTVVDSYTGAGGASWVVLASSVASLLNTAAKVHFDSCFAVETWLSRTPLYDSRQMEAFVRSKLQAVAN